jgi:hypothetical protein
MVSPCPRRPARSSTSKSPSNPRFEPTAASVPLTVPSSLRSSAAAEACRWAHGVGTINRNPEFVVPNVVVDAIAAFLRGREFRTIHYIGYADDVLLKALIREARYTLSLMDYWDRHYREAIDFCKEEGLDHSDPVVPDWLDGIPTYIEGAPLHEVLLQDIPRLHGQLDRLALRSGKADPGTPRCSRQSARISFA